MNGKRLDSAKRVMSGTWGELWLEGEYVAECYKFQAKYTYNKEDVNICGQMMTDTKVMSIKGAGTMGLHKVSSRMAKVIGDKIRDGKDVRFTIISKLADPDSFGAERVSLSNVSFDDFTVADWEAGVAGKIETTFTFTESKFLDKVEVP